MMLITLVSAKGAPGVTTAALALTAAATNFGPALMVEADPAGGVLDCWCGPLGEPGLLEVATKLRSNADAGVVWNETASVGPGVQVITGPTSPGSMSAALSAVDVTLGRALAALDASVVVDAGRWLGSGDAPAVLKASSTVVAVCRPTLDSIEHTRSLVSELSSITAFPSVLVVGGTKPYGPKEIEAALQVPVIGVLPWDPRGVTALLDPSRRRTWSGSPLATAAANALRYLAVEPEVMVDRV
jgi:MinD-like ATPase involved in chromosome partitioning or flagellar assembly